MTRVKLEVLGVINSQLRPGAYVMLLLEGGQRRLPVVVGFPEAQSIAMALEGIQPERPLTHDLLASFIAAFDMPMKEVLISRYEDGIFYSEMVFSNGTREIHIDSRPSDAVAIALRMGCGIYATEELMQKCGISVYKTITAEDEERLLPRNLSSGIKNENETLKEKLHLLQPKEIDERLAQAIREENYEFALLYNEELRRRKMEGEKND
jgi:bifunctional DNase/RNase